MVGATLCPMGLCVWRVSLSLCLAYGDAPLLVCVLLFLLGVGDGVGYLFLGSSSPNVCTAVSSTAMRSPSCSVCMLKCCVGIVLVVCTACRRVVCGICAGGFCRGRNCCGVVALVECVVVMHLEQWTVLVVFFASVSARRQALFDVVVALVVV